MSSRPRVAVHLLLGLAVLVTACTTDGPSAPSGRDDRIPTGGTLRMAVQSNELAEPAFLDPHRPYDVFFFFEPELFRCCLLRTLLSYNGRSLEEGGTELRPDLALDLPDVSSDGLSWTFRLQEGLRYAPPLDDVEITAADVARAVQRAARVEVAEGRHGVFYSVIQGYDDYADGEVDTISGLEIVDDHTLRVHLTEVTNDFAYRMALPASAPIPPSPADPTAPYGTASGHDGLYGPYLIASGPYMLEGAARLDPSVPAKDQLIASGLRPRTLTLIRNPSWDRSTDRLRGAYVDRIEITKMSLRDAERAIDAGTIDFILTGYNSHEQTARYLADPALAGRVFRYASDLFVGYAAMNLAVPPFDDVHVRRAVNLAYDAERFVRIGNELYADAVGGLRFTTFGHIAPDGTAGNLLRGYDPYPYDPLGARSEMARSAYDHDGDGLCDDAACDEVFALNTRLGFERYTDRVWIDGLRRIGITLEIRRIPDVQRFLETSADPSMKIALNLGTFWTADYPNASTLFPGHFGPDGIGRLPLGNVSLVGARPDQLEAWGYDVSSVPNVDEKIGECLPLLGFAQTLCWAELDQLLMEEVVPWVPQVGFEGVTIVSERVVRFSVDAALAAWAAPDQIALAADSD